MSSGTGPLTAETVAALQKRIQELESQLQASQRRVGLVQRQKNKAIHEKDLMKKQLHRFLAPDQLRSMEKRTMRGTPWTAATIQKALKLRLACGSRGYNTVRELTTPLPTERTIQRHIANYKFSPGVLSEILQSLAMKVNIMEQHERHAVLMLDEIQLTPGLAYDPSNGTVIGRPTIPLADDSCPEDALATHALVFMLGGVTTRWKQTVAYEFTGNSFSAAAVKKLVLSILTECEKIGLKIDAIVSDMGGGNRGLWKLFGVVVGKHSKYAVSCPHPCDRSRKLYFMADVPHLLKNLRNHLTNNQSIFLPDDIVAKHSLPCGEVNLRYVYKLVKLDAKHNLKIAPHLKEVCLGQGHFEKMKVGLAFSLFNHDTAAALRYLVQIGKLKKKALTTAWFFEVVFKWFKIMTSRTTKLAISRLDDVKYEDTISFLHDVVKLFESLKIGDPVKAQWKPIQTGVILATRVALELQDYYLNTKGFFCVLLSRFGQDALENLFSTLRSKNPVPKPLEFRCALRAATLAQFLNPSKDGSYFQDDGFSLVGIDKGSGSENLEHTPENGAIAFPGEILELSEPEQESLDYLAGYAVSSVLKNITCGECRTAVTSKEASTLTKLKSYTDTIRLAVPSPAVVSFLETAESLFRVNSDRLLQNKITLSQLEVSAYENVTFVNCFPSCHSIEKKLLRAFLKTRLHILLRKENERAALNKTDTKCGSRSIGKQAATRNVQ